MIESWAALAHVATGKSETGLFSAAFMTVTHCGKQHAYRDRARIRVTEAAFT